MADKTQQIGHELPNSLQKFSTVKVLCYKYIIG